MKTNLPGRNIVTAAIRGVVKATATAKIKVEPRKVYLESVRAGEIFNRRFQINNTGQLPLVIKKIYCPRKDALVLIDQSSGMTVAPDHTVTLDLRFQIQGNRPITEVVFFDTNASNARDGQYAVMLIVQEAE